MLDRRSLLRRSAGAVGTATLASTAGCLFDGDDGGANAAGFLADLPDPTPALVPSFHAAYSYDPAPLRNDLGADPLPNFTGQLVAIVGEMPGTTVDDVDRVSGQTVEQVGSSGTGLTFVTPGGTDLVVQGSFDVEGAATWLEDQGFSDLGEDRGYRRLGTGDQVVKSFAVDEDALLFGNREATGLSPSDLATASIDGVEDDAVTAADVSPELDTTIEALPGGDVVGATAFDLVAVRPDTGTAAFDAAAASLVAAGVAATIGGESSEITRILRYRRGRSAAVDDVRSAVDAAIEAEFFHDGDWTVSGSDRSVRIEGTVDTAAIAADASTLRRIAPAPGYDDLTIPVDPTALGRDAPPRVAWEPTLLDDGRLAIVHGGGPDVSNLEIAYTVDGERVREPWEGPVSEEDRFETSEVPDGGSYFDVVWARGTVNETILLRIELPEDSG